MDAGQITQMIGSLGFPIVASIALFMMVKDSIKELLNSFEILKDTIQSMQSAINALEKSVDSLQHSNETVVAMLEETIATKDLLIKSEETIKEVK